MIVFLTFWELLLSLFDSPKEYTRCPRACGRCIR
jgi:hypothetical protein